MPLVAYRNPQHYAVCVNIPVGEDGRVNQIRVVLRPGLNEIPEDQWNLAKEHPSLKAKIQKGIVEVISASDEGQEHASELRTMRVRESITLVKETIDEDVLRHWLEIETRDSVSDALSSQLAKVTKTQDQAEAEAKTTKKARKSRRKAGGRVAREPEADPEDEG